MMKYSVVVYFDVFGQQLVSVCILQDLLFWRFLLKTCCFLTCVLFNSLF